MFLKLIVGFLGLAVGFIPMYMWIGHKLLKICRDNVLIGLVVGLAAAGLLYWVIIVKIGISVLLLRVFIRWVIIGLGIGTFSVMSER